MIALGPPRREADRHGFRSHHNLTGPFGAAVPLGKELPVLADTGQPFFSDVVRITASGSRGMGTQTSSFASEDPWPLLSSAAILMMSEGIKFRARASFANLRIRK
jgi:hypothetical protein